MKYTKGKSGNPKGRPRGIRDKRVELRSLLEPHAAELVQKAVELAKDGDSAALRLCLDRRIPTLKARDEPTQGRWEGVDAGADLGRAVLRSMAAGEVTPDQASAMMGAIAAHSRIVEVDELERRVAALEKPE
jgi:hypothetical protein